MTMPLAICIVIIAILALFLIVCLGKLSDCGMVIKDLRTRNANLSEDVKQLIDQRIGVAELGSNRGWNAALKQCESTIVNMAQQAVNEITSFRKDI